MRKSKQNLNISALDVLKEYKDYIIILERRNGNPADIAKAHIIIDALEKQIAKKPNVPWDTQTEECPICQRSFIGEPKYCSRCGQKLEWSDAK